MTVSPTARSCADHLAPCMVAVAAATSPIVSHATMAAGHTRVLVVRKTGDGGAGTTMPVEVCADPGALGAAWAPTGGTAELVELLGSDGLASSATHGSITLGGRTLKGSLDGEWRGEAVTRTVVSRPGGGGRLICFDVDMAPVSAAMLVLRRGGH